MRLIKRSPVRHVIGLIRFIILKLWYARTLSTSGFSVFDADVSMFILNDGRIHLANKIIISKGVELQARGAHISIGTGTTVNAHSRIIAFNDIKIGERCAIAQFVSILDHDHTFHTDKRMQGYSSNPINIGNDVWVGDKATILQGVSIGNGARIGAGALVNRNVPAGCLAVGVPAKIITPKTK